MIHAYDSRMVYSLQSKLAEMFEFATLDEHVDIDVFANKFAHSEIGKSFEHAGAKYALGKSSNELVSILLNVPVKQYETYEGASPEYWVGWVLCELQYYLNKSYVELLSVYPCSELLNMYFPYHEMDIMHLVDLYREKMNIKNIQALRKERNLSQNQLAVLSDIPVRTIKAYEQGTLDLSKAQGDTLYKLSKTLKCSIEDLLLNAN